MKRVYLLPLFPLLAYLAGCAYDRDRAHTTLGGNADRGRALMAAYGCGSCHVVPGVRGANSHVGPPLAGIASRAYIGGAVPNVPANMVRWIMNPPALEPHTAMPFLGVNARDATDIAEYLYRLRAPGE